MCINSCGIEATVEDGKLVKVEGMKEHPISEGVLCPRGEALVEWVYSPDRLQYPMKKSDTGWKRISWDEALDTTAEKITKIKERYGARALAVYTGSMGTENIELAAFAQRFRGVYGTPNLLSVEGNCFRSRIMARQMTFGGYPIEEPWNAKCIVVFGTNVDNSKVTVGAKIYKAIEEGTMTQVIVVDPKRIPLADKGIHIKITTGHRHRPLPRNAQRDHLGRARGQGVCREILHGLRQAGRARQAVYAREGFGDHMGPCRGYPKDRPHLCHHKAGLYRSGDLLHRPAHQRLPGKSRPCHHDGGDGERGCPRRVGIDPLYPAWGISG